MLDKIMQKDESEMPVANYSPIVPQFTNYNHSFNEKTWMITHQKGHSDDEEIPLP